ncbi:hypothetical protein M0805_000572 [Coniferiporia weirii]|nr:hypothetical protein M0805_000572 [Coniferiporia weirii]
MLTLAGQPLQPGSGGGGGADPIRRLWHLCPISAGHRSQSLHVFNDSLGETVFYRRSQQSRRSQLAHHDPTNTDILHL